MGPASVCVLVCTVYSVTQQKGHTRSVSIPVCAFKGESVVTHTHTNQPRLCAPSVHKSTHARATHTSESVCAHTHRQKGHSHRSASAAAANRNIHAQTSRGQPNTSCVRCVRRGKHDGTQLTYTLQIIMQFCARESRRRISGASRPPTAQTHTHTLSRVRRFHYSSQESRRCLCV